MDDLTNAFSIGAPLLFVCALSCLWTSMRAAHAEERRLTREAVGATFDAYLASFEEARGDAAHFPELAEYLRAPDAKHAKKTVMDVVLHDLCRALAEEDAAREVQALVCGGRLYVSVVGAGEVLYADPGMYLPPGAPARLLREMGQFGPNIP